MSDLMAGAMGAGGAAPVADAGQVGVPAEAQAGPTEEQMNAAMAASSDASMGNMTAMQVGVLARVGSAAFDRACMQTLPDFAGAGAALAEMEFTQTSTTTWVLEEEEDAVTVRLGSFNGQRACFVDIYNTTKTAVMGEMTLFLDMRFGVTGLDGSEPVTTTSVAAASGPATISIARQNSGPSVVLSAY